jgi:hypothetical protein
MTIETDTTARAATAPMTRTQIRQAISGLHIFVAIPSSTIVTNALPTIVADQRPAGRHGQARAAEHIRPGSTTAATGSLTAPPHAAKCECDPIP